jgi:probable HAF family extracellular repeat protein
MQDLGLAPNGTDSTPWAVSRDGSVIVGEVHVTGMGQHAFRWTAPTGMVDLGVPTGSIQSHGIGVSGYGSVVGGYVEVNPYNAFRWTPSAGFELLGTPVGGTDSSGGGVSGNGLVIVGAATVAEGSRAFRWTAAEGFTTLGVPAGFTSSIAVAASGDGSVIVGRASAPGIGTAFRWTAPGGIQSLPGTRSASGISSDGSVVIGNSSGGAFLWTAARGTVLVQSLLGATLPPGWTLDQGYGVSADGLRVTGWGHDPAGHSEAWIATLTPDLLGCYANCDSSTAAPVLNVNDFVCFMNRFAGSDSYANCDGSSVAPVLNVNDFICFQMEFAAGCP